MRAPKSIRALATLASAVLVIGVLAAAPAEAKKKKCAPYKVPERAAEVDTTVVTDTATEDEPVELTVSTGPGFGVGRDPGGEGALVSHAFANLQVDSKAKAASLSVSLEFTLAFDYDLYVDTAEGIEVARAAGFNGILTDDGSSGGHSDWGLEQVDGVTTADCGGYTIDIVGATTPGEDVTLKFWLAK
jgi:hypothetical protein